ncbi:hypothetical protein BSKO_09882 [Bryopsis sp. KO-2023]|nr:hypothetical protein BSKO_09882 [Bryopsis sp. KO-2023]
MEGGGQPFASTGWSSAPPVRPRRGGSRSGGRRKHRSTSRSEVADNRTAGTGEGGADIASGLFRLNLDESSRAKTPEATASSSRFRFKFPFQPYPPVGDEFLEVDGPSGPFDKKDVGKRATGSVLGSAGLNEKTGNLQEGHDTISSGAFAWSVPPPFLKNGDFTTPNHPSDIASSSSSPFTMGAPANTPRVPRDSPFTVPGLESLNLNDGAFPPPPNSQSFDGVPTSPHGPNAGSSVERKRSSRVPDESVGDPKDAQNSKKVATENVAEGEPKFVFNTAKANSKRHIPQEEFEAGNYEKEGPIPKVARDQKTFRGADVAGLVSELNLGNGKNQQTAATQGPSGIYRDQDDISQPVQPEGSSGVRPRGKYWRGRGRAHGKKEVKNPDNSSEGAAFPQFEQKRVWPAEDPTEDGITLMDIDPPLVSPPIRTFVESVKKSRNSCIYSSGSENANSPVFQGSGSSNINMRYEFAPGVHQGARVWNKYRRRRQTSRLSRGNSPVPSQPESANQPSGAPHLEEAGENNTQARKHDVSVGLARAEACKERGNELFQAGKYYEAEVAYTQGTDVLGDTREGRLVLAVLYSNRGAARLMLKKPQEALVDSQTAIEYNRKYIKAYQRGAKCLLTLGQFDEAKSLLNKAADMLSASDTQYKTISEKIGEVEDLVTKLEECKASLALGSWSEDVANATLRKARALAEEVYVSESVAGVLAVVLLRAGRYGELCEHVHRFIKEREVESPEGATATIWWRWIHVQALWQMEGKSKEATGETKALLNWMSREGVSNLDCPFGSPSKICEVEIREFLEAMEEVSEHKEKGNEEIKKGLCKIAVESYTKGLAICGKCGAPPHVVAYLHSNRASAYLGLKKFAEAIGDCCRAKALLPGFYRPLSRLAQILFDTRQPEAAVGVLQQAMKCVSVSASEAASIQKRIAEGQNAASSEAMPNHYQILGVDQKCEENEIRKAYKMLALRFHPDKAMTSCRFGAKMGSSGVEYYGYNEICHRVKEEGSWLFKAINEANAALMDSDKRETLDSELAGFGSEYRRATRSGRNDRWRANSSSYHRTYTSNRQYQGFRSRWSYGFGDF